MVAIINKTNLNNHKKITKKRYFYKGVDIDSIPDNNLRFLINLLSSRLRRKINRWLDVGYNLQETKRPFIFIKKLLYTNKQNEILKTHIRNMGIFPELVRKKISVHNGKIFCKFAINVNMVDHYFGEFSLTYKPISHGSPGVGASSSSRFVPLK